MSVAVPELIDAVGARHAVAGADARIVCLVPSITELVIDLGLRKHLVGRTGFCIHPRDALRGIPKVGGTKDVNLDRIRALAPTHVIVNVDENTRETAEALADLVPHVIVTHPLAPADNFALYRLLGGIFGAEARAENLCAELTEALAGVRAGPVRRVLYLIWKDPWMTVGNDTYISRTLALFGWRTQPAAHPDRYPEVNLAEQAREVDLVLLSSEPYPFRPKHLSAVRAACGGPPVRLIDGEMTSWYGSRAISGLRYLAAFVGGDTAEAA
ncbi:MAG: helical backbone metal receptor [Gammaproteobacteria bacterium]